LPFRDAYYMMSNDKYQGELSVPYKSLHNTETVFTFNNHVVDG